MCWKAKKEMVRHVENDIKKMWVRGWRKIAKETDPEGGQGPT